MHTILLPIITFFTVLSCAVKSQTVDFFEENRTYDYIDTVIRKVENTIDENWFVVRNGDGFDIYFCKTCMDACADSLNSKYNTRYNRMRITRQDFFNTLGPDSIRYYSTVSHRGQLLTLDPNEEYKSGVYKKNGVIKISVQFEKKWSEAKYKEVFQHNESIKEDIIKEPLGKSNMDIFADYRFWVPKDRYLLDRSDKGDFIRLPYESFWYNYSIFIIPDKPSYFTRIMFLNEEGLEFKGDRVDLNQERIILLNSLAYCLGINDYNIVN